ncbi:hypothetical protein IH781_03580, partial [Patescibacteria group bacterium]|nr:hypothetical protein [Patescibacteria group bacterium]
FKSAAAFGVGLALFVAHYAVSAGSLWIQALGPKRRRLSLAAAAVFLIDGVSKTAWSRAR